MATKLTLNGVAVSIGEEKSGTSKSGREWKINTLLVELGNEQYPNVVEFTAWNGSCDKLKTLSEGDVLSIEFYVNGRTNKAGDRHFNTLTISAITVTSKSGGATFGEVEEASEEQETSSLEEADDIPF